MTAILFRILLIVLAGSLVGSCSPADEDIRVVWRNGALVVDFQPTLWRVFGLDDRTWCISDVEVFDASKMLWTMTMAADHGYSCAKIQMPFVIGQPAKGFTAEGTLRLKPRTRYGVGVDGIGDGRVDFVLASRTQEPINISDPDVQIDAPCGSYWAHPC